MLYRNIHTTLKTCQDFLGETETPAVAASPATEEVEEEAAW